MRGSYRWLVVAMLWCVCFFNYADRQAIFSVFTPIQGEMGLTDTELGIVGSSFMWVYAAAAPLAGIVGDRFRRKSLIIGGLIFWSAICAATALSTRYWHLVLFRALEGFGEAFYFPASMSLISDYHGPATRSRAMAFHQSSVYLGTMAGGTLAGYLADRHGWRTSFWLLGALGIALGAVLIAALREPRRGASEEAPAQGGEDGGAGPPAASRIDLRMACLLAGVFVGANFVAAIFLAWLPTFLTRKFGMTLTLAGFSGTAYVQAASILGVIASGLLADRLVRRHATGRMRVQAAGLLLGVPFIFITGWTSSVAILVAAMAAFGLAKGLYDGNIWAALHDFVPVERRASAVGLMNAAGWIGGSLGPVAIGWASGAVGMGPAIAATCVVYLAVGLLLIAGIRARGRRSSAAPPCRPSEGDIQSR